MPNSLNTTVRLKGAGKWTVFVIYSLVSLNGVGFPFYSTYSLWNPLCPGIIHSYCPTVAMKAALKLYVS